MALCACGRVHLVDPAVQACLDETIAVKGPTVSMTTPDGTWRVPRTYVAVHGCIEDAALPQLANDYHWARVA